NSPGSSGAAMRGWKSCGGRRIEHGRPSCVAGGGGGGCADRLAALARELRGRGHVRNPEERQRVARNPEQAAIRRVAAAQNRTRGAQPAPIPKKQGHIRLRRL